MNCIICGNRIEKEDGYIEKHLGVSGHSAVYHESCFLLSHKAAQQSGQGTDCPVSHQQQDFEYICDLCGQHIPARKSKLPS